MKTALFSLPLAAVLALGAVGCANESATDAEDVTAETEAESAEVETFQDTRGYRFVSKRIDSVLDDIEATETQRATANSLKDRFAKDMFEMRDEKQDIRAEVLEEWKKDDPDTEAMHALVDERIEVFRKMLHEMVDGASEMHESLTPEQRAQLAEIVEKRMKKHHR